jgi:20S proteasome subunit beta 4
MDTLLRLAGRYYCLSILDKHHHPNIDLDQGLKILQMCTDELKRRLPIDFKGVRDPIPMTGSKSAFEYADLNLIFRC